MLVPVLTPHIKGWVVVKVNLGKESPREEETTVDEDGERELSEDSDPGALPVTPRDKPLKPKFQKSENGFLSD